MMMMIPETWHTKNGCDIYIYKIYILQSTYIYIWKYIYADIIY